MIQLHGTAVDSDIIDALRFVKGTILNYEVMLNVPITNRGVALDIWAFLKFLKCVLNLSYLRNLLNFKRLSL